MLQNEGLQEKKNNMRHVHKILHLLRRGRGGVMGGICVGCEPICHFFKSIFWANKFLLLTIAISDSRKALLVLLCKLECFAVCWGFKLCLAIIYKLKVGKRGENVGNIASISHTHLFHNFYIHISLSTHFWRHCQASGFLLVCNYCLKF